MKKLLLLILALMILSGAALAKSVTVTGTGATPSEAENDALRLAVEKTLGVLVDSETLTENAAVVRDKIYTQSRGFVTDYSICKVDRIDEGSYVRKGDVVRS